MPDKLKAESDSTELLALKGVGAKTLEHLAGLGIRNLEDLLFHLPLRYQDRTRYTDIKQLKLYEPALVKARVIKAEIKYGKRRSLVVWLEDGTGLIAIRYFYFSMQQKSAFIKDKEFEIFGEVRPGPKSLEIVHPETSGIGKLKSDALTPIYPINKGLQQPWLRKIIAQALKRGKDKVKELLPEQILADFKFNNLYDSLKIAHQPPPGMGLKALAKTRKRLVFEEVLAHHLSFKKIRKKREAAKSLKIKTKGKLHAACLEHLKFNLTQAQLRVLGEIKEDLKSSGPMQRLLQGDVGSGKTIVAVLAALECIEAGCQVALMAPTEILVEQHCQGIKNLLDKLQITVVGLTSSMPKPQRKSVLAGLVADDIKLVIGTHALFQTEVEFNNLGLVIVDEQHRFGVGQRMDLLQKAKVFTPHQLIMTATPIPRTLAMTFYSYLDYSLIDELPPGRTPIQTVSLPQARRAEVIQRLTKYCADGKQAYWVCPLIDESEVLNYQAAVKVYADLQAKLKPLKIGLVHGRLKREEKYKIMHEFKSGKLHVLVATTVIEVGVDVPNASLMVIDNSERLGLSQLHQLRGRVGRGDVGSHCVLLYEAPLSDNAKARLKIMRETTDGFKIAEKDLEIRGPGELLGTRQAGDIKFRITDLSADGLMINKVISKASKIDTELSKVIRDALIRRWLGRGDEYCSV